MTTTAPSKTDTPAQATRRLFVEKQDWELQTIPAETVGLTRNIEVYRATRKTKLVTFDYHGDEKTFCPPIWYDLGIGSGACGLGCRSCFLMLTFRSMRDPLRHLLYSNVEDFWRAAERWLKDKGRRRQHTLGVGIDRSDSLLYEGVTGHARNLVPMFADERKNPHGNYLILLTKSANTHYLKDLPTRNVAVTFSMNPERIADLWEGKWPDTGERITPGIDKRLDACLEAQNMGFEVRFRVDPILAPVGWEEEYEAFFADVAHRGIRPRYVTLGSYREKNPQLDTWREKWGLPEMEWEPEELARDGTHRRVPDAVRIRLYETVTQLSRKYLPESRVSLCKETHSVRKALRLCNADCNCLM